MSSKNDDNDNEKTDSDNDKVVVVVDVGQITTLWKKTSRGNYPEDESSKNNAQTMAKFLNTTVKA